MSIQRYLAQRIDPLCFMKVLEGLLEEAQDALAHGERKWSSEQADASSLTLQLEELRGEIAMQRVELDSERVAKEKGSIEIRKLKIQLESREMDIKQGRAEGTMELQEALSAVQKRMDAMSMAHRSERQALEAEKATMEDYVAAKEMENAQLESQLDALAAATNHNDTVDALHAKLKEEQSKALKLSREFAEQESALTEEILALREREQHALAVACQGQKQSEADAEASVTAAVRIIAYEQALEKAQRAEADAKVQLEASEAMVAQAQGEVSHTWLST